MKSKSILVTLSLAAFLHPALAQSVADSTPTLSNPGFEDQLTDWETVEDGGMSKAIAEAAHEGKFGLRVTDDSEQAGSGLYSRKSSVMAGKKYEVQFWARTLSGSGAGVYLRFYGADGKVISPSGESEKTADRTPVVEVDKNPNGWKMLSGKKTAPAGAVSTAIYIHSYSKHKVTVDFDDFALSEAAN